MGSRVRQFRRQLGLASATVLCVLLSGAVSGSTPGRPQIAEPEPEFRFTRLIYSDSGFGRFGNRAWTTDAPEAEHFLLNGIRRLTRINANTVDLYRPNETVIRKQLTDPDVFDHPFLYGVEVGNWYLSDEEAANLREYLLRGGFLMVDDFHGDLQWEVFMESLRRVFPDRDVHDIPDDHEVFHVLYDLDHKEQIPGIQFLRSGLICEQCGQGGSTPHWRGVFDDDGRVMVVINFNMDLGDAWEHADHPQYPQPWTALAYRFAISYVLYAMTH